MCSFTGMILSTYELVQMFLILCNILYKYISFMPNGVSQIVYNKLFFIKN